MKKRLLLYCLVLVLLYPFFDPSSWQVSKDSFVYSVYSYFFCSEVV